MSVMQPIKSKSDMQFGAALDLTEYRSSDAEQNRTLDLMRLVSTVSDKQNTALDIGARDGHFSLLLANYFNNVTALDLQKPVIPHESINCVAGNLLNLQFDNNAFDLVFCSEVLEHIPPQQLAQACSELQRAASRYLIIGVPFQQDIRFGRTTCYSCMKKNPPWGHVNSFDQQRLIDLFPSFTAKEVSFVGETNDRTNSLSRFLMDLAGNPYGTYMQNEHCIHCDQKLKQPPARTFLQKVFTKIAFKLTSAQRTFTTKHPNWIHILFEKNKPEAN
jgi:hypothetical protein